MAELQTLARPYARAAFGVACERKTLAQWGDAMARLALAAADEKLATVIGHPDVGAEVLVKMLTELAEAKDLDGVENLLKILAENRRLILLPAIAEEFASLRSAFERRCKVSITSAADLGDAQRGTISQALQKRLGADVSVTWAVDEELIGGAVVSTGDLVIDGSVRGELDRLRAALTQ
jgi:F-type H+-transporting ATPase subunit delta